MKKSKLILKFISIISLPILILASCGYSKSQPYYIDLTTNSEEVFNTLWGINNSGNKSNKKAKNDNSQNIVFYIGISSCPFCHALKDLDTDATSAMETYMTKYGDKALDGWFKKNTEKGYGPLNTFAKSLNDHSSDKGNLNTKVYGTWITGYKVGDFPIGDNWTYGLSPKWQWVGNFIDQLKRSNTPYYSWNDSSQTFTVGEQFNYAIPILIFAKPTNKDNSPTSSYWTKYNITGYLSGYLTESQLWQAYMQFILAQKT
ncbi:hypothetical protein [Mycoplasma sp. SG1]|uniref:hypothetical protein n=1 Tax=Mycoplasma sp. SG1 TaxID=2810348 RepID=UPI0020257767|nr:hypothetical protein [Mycoplasma sp. SG1]URM53244.1 hypothetical protein JRW51_02780 [Mycoplasma sp. SG1]